MNKLQLSICLILIIYTKALSDTTDTIHNTADTVLSKRLSIHQHSPSLELCISSGYPWVTDFDVSFSPVDFFSLTAAVSKGLFHSSQYSNSSKIDFGIGLQRLLNNYVLFKFGLAFEGGIIESHETDSNQRLPGPGYSDSYGPPFILGVKILSGSTVYFTKKQTFGVGMQGFLLIPITPSGDGLIISMAGVQIGLLYTIK